MAEIKVDASRINLKLEQMPDDVRAALLDAIISQGGELVDLARSRAGELLQVHTGKFIARIRFGLRRSKNRLTGRVYTTDPAAPILEFGGQTKPHEILPNKARALPIGGGRFAARVQHPGGHYEPRKIIMGAFDERKEPIAAALENAADGAAARASA